MKLQQLRYIQEVANRNLSVTAAAEALHTSQPGVSKQIRIFEEQLGVQVFERAGKNLSGITQPGQQILEITRELLLKADQITALAADIRNEHSGEITIATTHTQARYALPEVIKAFRQKYPKVALHIQQGSPKQIALWASRGEVDFCIATEAMELFDNLVMMPCYHWNRCVVVPKGHPLTEIDSISLSDIAKHPLITYVFGFTGRSKLDDAFEKAGVSPDVVLTAVDADVIKTYVRNGLGIGIVANMAYDKVLDSDLVAIDASHLFTHSTTRIGFRYGTWLRGYMYEFINLFASHLNRDMVQQLIDARTPERRDRLYKDLGLELPTY
ncbi:MAG: LysR family cys regulon transcriptional activator [Pseudoalteromonas tetraodonis]|jgi:LysR family cys regulon transcriptional activator